MVQVTLAPVVSSLDSALSSLERPFYIKFCIAAQRYCLSSLIIRIVTNMHLKLFHFSMWLLYLPRDAMQNRGLCCRPVSVCPSRSCIVSRWLKMSNFFLGTLAPCCFFCPQAPVPNSMGSPYSGGGRLWEIFAIFDWNHRLSRKRYETGPFFAMQR